jgi:hypothetical protein
VYTGQCPVPQGRAALELASLGNSLRYNSPDCSVYTGLSGEPAEQRLLRANGHLHAHLMRARSAQKSGTRETVHRTIYSTCPVYTGQCPVSHGRAALELVSLGNSLRYNSPDCPVYTGLSGEPAEQRLLRANGHLQAHLMRARSAQKSGTRATVHRTLYSTCPVYTGQPGGPRRQKLQR